ncbi:MarR family winged helix-turn-helix transcriptional regulator [Castellaniella denitrificans]|uniref:MarR family winged helix-turn-helix transcriptional regulator n=1 Tax=Castellaniella denitrificans TaxID=56119 RepID=UPI003623902F
MTRPARPRPVPTPPLERSFTYRFNVLRKGIDRQSAAGYLKEVGVSLSDGRCLAAIGRFAPLSIKELANRSHLNKSQASRAAQSLVDRGLVRKDGSPEDGRGVVLTLTAAGREAWNRTMRFVHERNQEILGCLSDDEYATLSALLDRLIAHTLARDGAAGEDTDESP